MVEIPLYGRAGLIGHTMVDDEDEELLLTRRWNINKGYAVVSVPHPAGGRKSCGRLRQYTLRMHRLIMGLEYGDPLEPDHIDGNRLNNQRFNLRIGSHAANMENQSSRRGTSVYRGVSFSPQTGKWRANCCLNYRITYLGYHDTEEEAERVVSLWRAEHMPFSLDAR